MTKLTDAQIVADLLGSLRHAGYNVDRASAVNVLAMVLTDLRNLRDAAELCRRYLADPLQIIFDKECQRQAFREAMECDRRREEASSK